MLLLLFYFGVNMLGVRIDAWTAAALAFTIGTSAYLAEIWRGCIQAVPKGAVGGRQGAGAGFPAHAGAGHHPPGGAHGPAADRRLHGAGGEGHVARRADRLHRARKGGHADEHHHLPARRRLRHGLADLLRDLLAAVDAGAASRKASSTSAPCACRRSRTRWKTGRRTARKPGGPRAGTASSGGDDHAQCVQATYCALSSPCRRPRRRRVRRCARRRRRTRSSSAARSSSRSTRPCRPTACSTPATSPSGIDVDVANAIGKAAEGAGRVRHGELAGPHPGAALQPRRHGGRDLLDHAGARAAGRLLDPLCRPVGGADRAQDACDQGTGRSQEPEGRRHPRRAGGRRAHRDGTFPACRSCASTMAPPPCRPCCPARSTPWAAATTARSTCARARKGEEYEQKFPLRAAHFGIGIRRGNPELLQWLNTFVYSIKNTGELDAISKKWRNGAPMIPLPVF